MTLVEEEQRGNGIISTNWTWPTEQAALPGVPTEPAQWPRDWRSIHRKADKVAILGHSPSTRDDAPYSDPSYEIWTLNDASAFLKGRRIDRWFEIHTRNVYANPDRRVAGFIDFLQKFAGPVYMLDPDPSIPTAVLYPKEHIEGKYGRLTNRQGKIIVEPVLTSGFSYMTCIALEEGFKRIEFYGADLMGEEEYIRQREGFAFLYGIALGRGVEAILPDACPILRAPLYGQNPVETTGLTEDEISNALAKARQSQGKAAAETNYWSGYSDALTKLRAQRGK